MRSWYVLVFNSRIMQWVEEECARLGVEVYSPLLVTVKARSDRPSSRRDEKLLFPGYAFLRFDPEVINPSAVNAVSGVKGLLSFDGEPHMVSSTVIAGMKNILLLRAQGGRLSDSEYRSLPPGLTKTFSLIIEMRREEHRRAALYAFLHEMALKERRGVYSSDGDHSVQWL